MYSTAVNCVYQQSELFLDAVCWYKVYCFVTVLLSQVPMEGKIRNTAFDGFRSEGDKKEMV